MTLTRVMVTKPTPGSCTSRARMSLVSESDLIAQAIGAVSLWHRTLAS